MTDQKPSARILELQRTVIACPEASAVAVAMRVDAILCYLDEQHPDPDPAAAPDEVARLRDAGLDVTRGCSRRSWWN